MTKKTKRRILLANTHMGTNIGDHLITLAELDFFEKYLSDYEIIELTASEIDERFDEIRDYISADDIIAISGGGYMGSLWPIYGEYNVRRIVSELPDNQIIIMPQSIYYDDTEEDKEQLQISRKIYLSHKRLSVCIRESDRLSYIKSLFGNKINCKAYPDMVFSMERKEYSLVRNGIGVCFRADKESVMAEEKKQEIINYLDDEVIFFDMHSDIPVIGSERSECVKKYINMIAGLRYVITDRLHCMLICMITGTPCIAFDNLTGKVSGVYQWMDESRYISVVNSVQEVVEYIGRYSGNENNKWCSWDNAYKKFEDLAKDIKIESDR
jgi:pyruvyl transferase EpsI